MNKSSIAALLMMPSILFAAASDPLAVALRTASAPAPLVLPNSDEYADARALFEDILNGRAADSIRGRAARLDMVWEALAGDEDIWLLREADHARRGRGFLAVRRDGRGALQMPHSFKDEMTRDIGLALFREGRFAAALWNTVPRRFEQDGHAVMADMAHLDSTWFNAFTEAWARAQRGSLLLQLHGFDDGKRKTSAAAASDMIISSGDQPPPAALSRLRDCLARSGLGRIGLYGDTVKELGGTTNAQVRLLRRLGVGTFVHMEMDRDLRQALRDHGDRRAQLLACFPMERR